MDAINLSEVEDRDTYDAIRSDFLTGLKKVKNPRLIWLGGQAGIGKSTYIEDELLKQFKAEEVLVIDYDKLRDYHPYYKQLIDGGDNKNAATKVQADVAKWAMRLLDDASKLGVNIIFESGLTNLKVVQDGSKTAKGYGYRNEIVAIAKNEHWSIQGIVWRFWKDKQRVNNGEDVNPRFVPFKVHDWAYHNGVHRNLRVIEASREIDEVTVIDPQYNVVYKNALDSPNKLLIAGAYRALQLERMRPILEDEELIYKEQDEEIRAIQEQIGASNDDKIQRKSIFEDAISYFASSRLEQSTKIYKAKWESLRSDIGMIEPETRVAIKEPRVSFTAFAEKRSAKGKTEKDLLKGVKILTRPAAAQSLGSPQESRSEPSSTVGMIGGKKITILQRPKLGTPPDTVEEKPSESIPESPPQDVLAQKSISESGEFSLKPSAQVESDKEASVKAFIDAIISGDSVDGMSLIEKAQSLGLIKIADQDELQEWLVNNAQWNDYLLKVHGDDIQAATAGSDKRLGNLNYRQPIGKKNEKTYLSLIRDELNIASAQRAKNSNKKVALSKSWKSTTKDFQSGVKSYLKEIAEYSIEKNESLDAVTQLAVVAEKAAEGIRQEKRSLELQVTRELTAPYVQRALQAQLRPAEQNDPADLVQAQEDVENEAEQEQGPETAADGASKKRRKRKNKSTAEKKSKEAAKQFVALYIAARVAERDLAPDYVEKCIAALERMPKDMSLFRVADLLTTDEHWSSLGGLAEAEKHQVFAAAVYKASKDGEVALALPLSSQKNGELFIEWIREHIEEAFQLPDGDPRLLNRWKKRLAKCNEKTQQAIEAVKDYFLTFPKEPLAESFDEARQYVHKNYYKLEATHRRLILVDSLMRFRERWNENEISTTAKQGSVEKSAAFADAFMAYKAMSDVDVTQGHSKEAQEFEFRMRMIKTINEMLNLGGDYLSKAAEVLGSDVRWMRSIAIAAGDPEKAQDVGEISMLRKPLSASHLAFYNTMVSDVIKAARGAGREKENANRVWAERLSTVPSEDVVLLTYIRDRYAKNKNLPVFSDMEGTRQHLLKEKESAEIRRLSEMVAERRLPGIEEDAKAWLQDSKRNPFLLGPAERALTEEYKQPLSDETLRQGNDILSALRTFLTEQTNGEDVVHSRESWNNEMNVRNIPLEDRFKLEVVRLFHIYNGNKTLPNDIGEAVREAKKGMLDEIRKTMTRFDQMSRDKRRDDYHAVFCELPTHLQQAVRYSRYSLTPISVGKQKIMPLHIFRDNENKIEAVLAKRVGKDEIYLIFRDDIRNKRDNELENELKVNQEVVVTLSHKQRGGAAFNPLMPGTVSEADRADIEQMFAGAVTMVNSMAQMLGAFQTEQGPRPGGGGRGGSRGGRGGGGRNG